MKNTHLSAFSVSLLEYGGLGLDFSYSVAVSEELGNIRCGGVPMAIGVQTDMATPALSRYCTLCVWGSEENYGVIGIV